MSESLGNLYSWAVKNIDYYSIEKAKSWAAENINQETLNSQLKSWLPSSSSNTAAAPGEAQHTAAGASLTTSPSSSIAAAEKDEKRTTPSFHKNLINSILQNWKYTLPIAIWLASWLMSWFWWIVVFAGIIMYMRKTKKKPKQL